MNRLTITLCSVALLAFTACGGGDSITDSFNDLVTAQNQVTEKVCSCATDPVACEAMFGLSDADANCIRGVLADFDTEAARAALDCQAAAGSDYHACINPIACDDMTTAADDCDAAYDAAFEACPAVPADLDAAVESTCFPE